MAAPIDPAVYARDSDALALTLRDLTILELEQLWFGLPDHHRASQDGFARAAARIIEAAQRSAVDITYGYLSFELAARGEAVAAPLYDAVTGTAVRDVPLAEVYARPFVDVWADLADGQSLDDALDHGMSRLNRMANVDIQLANTHTVRDVYSRSRTVNGYRRVTHGATSCALCIIASTQMYRKRDLMPIHPGCRCTVVAADRPLDHLDDDLLEMVHAEIEARFGVSDRSGRKIDYRKILLTREHGEYGPVLTYSSDRFTGPDDLVRPAVRRR